MLLIEEMSILNRDNVMFLMKEFCYSIVMLNLFEYGLLTVLQFF